MAKKVLRLLVLLPMLATICQADVWIFTHRTNVNGSGAISSSGADSVGTAPNSTLLTAYASATSSKKGAEIYLSGRHYDVLSLKSDKSEVVGFYTTEDRELKWCIHNIARVQAENKVTALNPTPGYQIVDVRYVNDRVNMLQRKDKSYRCDEKSATGNEWKCVFTSSNGDLSQLVGFPQASVGEIAMQMVTKMPYVAPQGAPVISTDAWYKFFGPRGTSDQGGFDAKSGVIAVRSTWGNDDVLTIARVKNDAPIAPIKISKPGFLRQIAVIGEVTYIGLGNDIILAYDLKGKQIGQFRGMQVLVP